MRILRSLVPAVLLTVGACKGTEPPPVIVPAAITLTRGDNQLAIVGQAVRDTVKFRVTQADGTPAPGVTVSFMVTAGGGALASTTVVTNAQGEAVLPAFIAGPTETENRVVATVGNFTASVKVNGTISFYNIDIVFLTAPSTAQRAAFESATRKWRQIIQNELTDITIDTNDPNQRCGNATFTGLVDDIVIFADLVPIDGPGMVLGSAGPCLVRTTNNGTVITFTIAGVMRFDTADLQTLEDRGQLNNVILHEMGHVLGIGSLWTNKGVLDTVSVAGDPVFTGPQAAGAFLAPAFGGAACNCRPVPVENGGGPGTRLSHWRESVLTRELMTGFLNTGSNPLSALTVNSLRDIGYTVDATKADFFTLGIAFSALNTMVEPSLSPAPGMQSGFQLNEVEPDFDLRGLDDNGKLVRIFPRSSKKL